MARAPNHLGDGIMARPALEALSRVASRLVIQAPPWGPVVYEGVDAELVARGIPTTADAAVLFPPSLRVAWEARRCRRRIGVAADFRRWLLTDVVEPAEHRADTYARLAAVLGAEASGPPRIPRPQGRADVPPGHVGLNPVSLSGPVREWRGMHSLVAQLDRPVVWYGGPGDEWRVADYARGTGTMRVGMPLPELARALKDCAVFVSCDSGAAHFAAALGVKVVVIHGSTTASRTGTAGALAVEGPALACRPCYKQYCRYNLGCFTIPVHAVLDRIEEALG